MRVIGAWRPLGPILARVAICCRSLCQGTRLDLTVRRGDYRAFLFVSVDGEPANALPRDAEGRAYVVLYDPSTRRHLSPWLGAWPMGNIWLRSWPIVAGDNGPF